MNTNGPCLTTLGTVIKLNKTKTEQEVRSFQIAPYTALKFTFSVIKDASTYNFTALIILVEVDIPELKLNYAPGLLQREVAINEELSIEAVLAQNQNPDLIDFSTSVVYDFNTKGIVRFDFTKLRLKIWEKFTNFRGKNELTLRISAHDPRFYMPSIANLNLMVNLPPSNTKITITPEKGKALFTNFTIIAIDSIDSNLPITFKFHYYLQMDDY